MSTVLIKSPPLCVKGMTVWNQEAFSKTIRVPVIDLEAMYVTLFKKYLEKYLLKMKQLHYVVRTDNTEVKRLLLDPDLVTDITSFPPEHVAKMKESKLVLKNEDIKYQDVHLTIDNWKPRELLEAVLQDLQGADSSLSSYSTVGHIVHVNLKENHIPFKSVIGNILMTLPNISLVVNKSSSIDNTFRNFEMEVLAGEPNFLVSVKENGARYQFDFSKVYWNPRLSTEHERLVKMLNSGDVLFDVFAGVGPFAVPAAKKCSKVYANDLNPESFKWLQENVQLNKAAKERVSCSNLDGRDFVTTILKTAAVENLEKTCHVSMNLPALAIEFLDAFVGLFREQQDIPKLMIHVYCFTNDMEAPKADVQKRCEIVIGCSIDTDVAYVRNVAPNKDMYRASFTMPQEVLIRQPKNPDNGNGLEPEPKKRKSH